MVYELTYWRDGQIMPACIDMLCDDAAVPATLLAV